MIELSTYSLRELRDLEIEVKCELEDRLHDQIMAARARIVSLATALGVPVEKLVQGLAKEYDPQKIKYRHPSHYSKEWTGRGRKPAWVREWLENGGALDQLHV